MNQMLPVVAGYAEARTPFDLAVQAGKMFDLRMEAARAARTEFPPIREGDFDTPPVSHPHFAVAYDFQLAKMVREAGMWSALTQPERDRLLAATPVGEAA